MIFKKCVLFSVGSKYFEGLAMSALVQQIHVSRQSVSLSNLFYLELTPALTFLLSRKEKFTHIMMHKAELNNLLFNKMDL